MDRDALAPQDLCESRDLVQPRRQQRGLACVDVNIVQRDPVDADRGQKARIVLHPGEVLPQLAVLVEQRVSGVAALRLPHRWMHGHIVPVVQHPDRLRGNTQGPAAGAVDCVGGVDR